MDVIRFQKLWVLVLCLALCLSLAGCGRAKLTQANFDKIQTGMTLAQVRAILGDPTESHSVNVAVVSGTVSEWRQGEVTISIQFVNDRVVAKQFSKGKR